MTVMAVMAMMAWQGVDGIVRARDASQGRLEQTLRLDTVIAQWEQDLASIQESTAVPALPCDGSTVRLTRRAEGGLQVVAWALRPGRHRLRSGGAGRARSSPPSASCRNTGCAPSSSRAASPASCARSTGPGELAGLFLPGQRLEQLPVDRQRRPAASPAAARRRPPAPQALPSGVRIVLSFAPGSGQNGSLTRDSLLGP